MDIGTKIIGRISIYRYRDFKPCQKRTKKPNYFSHLFTVKHHHFRVNDKTLAKTTISKRDNP